MANNTVKSETNLSDCCVGLQTSATLDVFLTLGEARGMSCGLFCNSISYKVSNGHIYYI